MSGDSGNDLQTSRGGGFSPAIPDPQLRLSELQAVAVPKQFESPVIRWSIYAAGAAGVCDVLHWFLLVIKAVAQK